MKKYKKEWETFLIEYFQNKEYVTRQQLWMDVSNPYSRIYSIYEQTIKTKNRFNIVKTSEIIILIKEYGIINMDSFGYIRLNEEVKRREKIKNLKK